MRCKLCHSAAVALVPFDVPADAGRWVRCGDCGSDSNSLTYADVKGLYADREKYNEIIGWTNIEEFRESCRGNCEWFGHHHRANLPKDFLDVGCWHGAALDVMQLLGWSVHGFDVVPPPYMGPHVTVRPFFHRWWWGYKFSAILLLEVWEHVQTPELILHELHGALYGGGLLQIQTPRTIDRYDYRSHRFEHLHVASVGQLRKMLNDAMFDVIEERQWEPVGVAILCRARD